MEDLSLASPNHASETYIQLCEIKKEEEGLPEEKVEVKPSIFISRAKLSDLCIFHLIRDV